MTEHKRGIYQLRADHSRFRWISVRRSRMRPLGLLLRGRPLRDTWIAPELEELVDEELPFGPVADCAHLDGVPAFSARAIEVLEDFLKENGELLPTRSDFGEFFVYNVTRVIDALDEAASNATRFESTGRVKSIEKYAFHWDRLRDASVFRLPQVASPTPFVTDMFVSRVRATDLTGFRFLPLTENTTLGETEVADPFG